MKKIKFSVLMSIYKNDNVEYVKIAVDSLLNQTLLPDQIVIMVDGPISKEITSLLNKYQKNKLFDIHFRKENMGLGITMNEGINYCKNEYIARMDADDYSEPNRFEKQISYLEKNPSVSVIGCNVIEYDSKLEKKINIKKVPETNKEIKEYAMNRNPMNHPTVIFKKSKVLEVGSYEDYSLFEDYYLWAKLINKNCEFYNIQECLYKFRGGSNMYKRRGGISYLKKIKKFEKGLLDLGIINKRKYKENITKRYIAALLPSKIRSILYKTILREKII